MPLSSLARTTGLLGGLAWLLRWPFVGAADAVAYWLGLLLLVVSLAAYGAGLVTATWLRAVTALALPVLVWSALLVVRGGPTDEVVDALLGLGMVVVALVGLGRSRPSPGRQSSGRQAPVTRSPARRSQGRRVRTRHG